MELKASDLRIGNLIEIEENHKVEIYEALDLELNDIKDMTSNYFEIVSISKDEVNILVFKDEYDFDLLDIKLIPLTEEWLIKFGFRFKSESERYVIGKLNEESNFMYEFIIIHHKGKFYNNRNVEIKYVHLLQNAYYFDLLRGKELTIKSWK